jgi:hypothetical protein
MEGVIELLILYTLVVYNVDSTLLRGVLEVLVYST